ncbi:MAG: DUF1573 domain-containing protein [Chitinophagaceae bacterium]
MKKLFVAVGMFLFTASAVLAQDAQKKAEELVKFKEISYNFGKIKQGVPVNHDFPFSNISSTAVVVESANASCGCTTPTWPKAPILKDKSDKITAGFNAAAPGPFNKSIYVKIAGTSAPVELKISGEVLNADAYAEYEKTKSTKQ